MGYMDAGRGDPVTIPSNKSRFALLLVAAACLALGACGRRGPLEPHPDAPPEQRAKPAADGDSAGQPPRAAIGGSRRTLSSPIPPPRREFILDKIL